MGDYYEDEDGVHFGVLKKRMYNFEKYGAPAVEASSTERANINDRPWLCKNMREEMEEMRKKRVKGIDKAMVLLMFILSAILTPIGLLQYSLWADGKPYSIAFMAMGLLFPFLMLAKIVEIKRR